VVSVTPRPLFTPGKDPVPIVQGLAPGPVWTGAENLSPTRIRSQDRPARSQSPYRLSYPAHMVSVTTPKKSSHCLSRVLSHAARTQGSWFRTPNRATEACVRALLCYCVAVLSRYRLCDTSQRRTSHLTECLQTSAIKPENRTSCMCWHVAR